MNLVISQALASGLPVISTYHSGIPEQVENGVNGFLVAEGDYLALARYILKLIDCPTLLNQMSKNARQRICQKYDKNKLLANQAKVYKKFLNEF
jgi:colanic acid/amylovoran biosynthesis glycosyltransferase